VWIVRAVQVFASKVGQSLFFFIFLSVGLGGCCIFEEKTVIEMRDVNFCCLSLAFALAFATSITAASFAPLPSPPSSPSSSPSPTSMAVAVIERYAQLVTTNCTAWAA
jgi:hypothetical protein